MTITDETNLSMNAGRLSQNDRHEYNRDGDDEKLILPRKRCDFEHRTHFGEDRIGIIEVQKRRAVHDADVDGIKRGIDDDAGKQTINAHFRLQKRRDEAGDHADRHSGGDCQKRMPGKRNGRADDRAEREATVCGKVAYVQHGIAQKQCQNSQRADETELQRCLPKGQD